MRVLNVLAVVVIVLSLAATCAVAGPFEPAFKIEEAVGECMVRPKGSSEYVEAREGQAYAYGSMLKTGRDGDCLIVFSEGNTCRMAANTDLVVGENAKQGTAKELSLQGGKVVISLLSNYLESNSLSVETPAAAVEALGGSLTVEARTESDLKITAVHCTDGQLKVINPYFDVAMMDKNDYVSVSAARDDSFIRIKDIKGDFELRYTNEKQEQKTVAMETDSVVKIWRRPAAEGTATVVTVLVVSPDGALSEAVNFTIETAAPPEMEVVQVEPTSDPVGGDGVGAPVGGAGTGGGGGDDDDDDDDLPPASPPGGGDFGVGSVTEVTSFTPVGLR